MTYQSRSAWTSRPNRSVKPRFKQQHLTWHYPGFGSDSIKTASWPHSRCLRQIDTWERQHQARGSQNIEYNLFACAHGYLIEGRGDRQNGANGTSYSNRRGMSCQVLIGDNEPLAAGHRAAMREAVAWCEGKHPGMTATQYGHRHWVGTRCPGPYVMAEIPVRALTGRVPGLGASAGGYRPSTTAPDTAPSGPLFDDVDKTQEWLAALGYDPGPIDGIYGSKTEAATRQAQQDLDITPADGRPGPATRHTLEAAVSTLNDMADDVKAIRDRTDRYLDAPTSDIPRKVLEHPVPLEGAWKGQTGTLAGVRAYYAEDMRLIRAGLASAQAAVVTAVQQTGRAQGLTDDQIQAIAAEVAAAATRVSAEDIAGRLQVTVTQGEG